ncbi:glycosyltransferase [Mangrovactinospora gilvigrisea]|uniref:glycosyltransferase n=1 Tax=Mangrovactinospora gilvigrisea TaxID=1428644 RepID=UPI0008FC2AAC
MLGQVRPEKGVQQACELAEMSGKRLVLAGPLARRNEAWFRHEIIGRFGDDRVEWIGEVREPARSHLLETSSALVFLSDPPEPLGLVMLEAMSAGTPVLALNRGACSELVIDGISGFIRDNLEDLAESVSSLTDLAVPDIQSSVAGFSATRVAETHIEMYANVISNCT